MARIKHVLVASLAAVFLAAPGMASPSPDFATWRATIDALSVSKMTKRPHPLPHDPLATRSAARAKFASVPHFQLVGEHFVPDGRAAALPSVVHARLGEQTVAIGKALVAHAGSPSAPAEHATPVPASVDYGAPVISQVVVDDFGAGQVPVEQGSTIAISGSNLGGLSHVTSTPYGAAALFQFDGCSGTHFVKPSMTAVDGSGVMFYIPASGEGDAPWLVGQRTPRLTLTLLTPGGEVSTPLEWASAVSSYTYPVIGVGASPNNGNDSFAYFGALGFVQGKNTTIASPTYRAVPALQTTELSGIDTYGTNVHLVNGYTLDSITLDPAGSGSNLANLDAPAGGTQPGQSLTTSVRWTVNANHSVAGAALTYTLNFNITGPDNVPPTDALPPLQC